MKPQRKIITTLPALGLFLVISNPALAEDEKPRQVLFTNVQH